MAIGDQQPVVVPSADSDSGVSRDRPERLRRRADLLLNCAQALHCQLDIHAVVTCLASRVQELLEVDVVAVLRREGDLFGLEALAATDPTLNQTLQNAHSSGGFELITDLAKRAHIAGEPISVSIGSYDPAAALFPAPGQLLAAPMRSPEANGALVTYRASIRPFDHEERSVLAALAGLGALAIANAELYARANARGRELQQLLEITSELGGTARLQDFLDRFAARAAEFLGFERSFIAVTDDGVCQIRCICDHGVARPVTLLIPESLAASVQASVNSFRSNDNKDSSAAELSRLAGFETQRALCVPLAASDGAPLGVLGLLDPREEADITDEHVRRARILAAEVASALQAARGLHASAEHRRRSEILMSLALELNSTLRLSDFGESFTRRAVDTFGCRAAALAVVQEKRLEMVHLYDRSRAYDAATQYSLAAMLTEASASPSRAKAAFAGDSGGVRHERRGAHSAFRPQEPRSATHDSWLVEGPATELLGGSVASLGWRHVALARMNAPDGSLIGCLLLVDLPQEQGTGVEGQGTRDKGQRESGSASDGVARQSCLSTEGRELLRAIVAHAAVALDNARLFTRMDQANRHWMEIFDAITDLIVVHDERLRVLRVNRSLADFIGVSPNELIGVSMRAMMETVSASVSVSPSSAIKGHSKGELGTETETETGTTCPFCRVVGGGSEAQGTRHEGLADEYIHPVLDRTYLVSTSRVHGGDGLKSHAAGRMADDRALYGISDESCAGPIQTIHVLKDITDRREAERRYRELFDTIQEGLFFSTPEGRFIEVNEALVRMLGYDCREDLLAVDISREIYTDPEQRDHFRREIQERGMVRNYQETLRRRDGSLIYTLQNAFAVRDSHGNVVQYRGLILDITELKTFQGELQRQRDFNTKILDNTQSMIMVVDTAGLISYGNRRCFEAGGYTQDELLGRRLVDLVPNPRRSALAGCLADTLSGHQVDNLELPILLGQGRSGQFSINLSPMRDESGTVNSIVAVMTDISDAAMLQAKLMHTEKMAAVGQLVSGVAHEVNNPLTAVLGFTDLLLENEQIPEKAKDDLRVVLHEAQRTKQIVQNLLSFARQTPPERHAVQVNLVLRRTLALRSYDFANHGIQIIERLEDDIPEILADAHQLQQVFLNILNNAYDAVQGNDRPGRIEISTSAAHGWTEVVFRDNGHGISYPERIFDPFFTTKEVGKGTGLGLSICYGIVREHGGEILCRNNSTTPGATFTVRLPSTGGQRGAACKSGFDSGENHGSGGQA